MAWLLACMPHIRAVMREAPGMLLLDSQTDLMMKALEAEHAGDVTRRTLLWFRSGS